jgi:hypothetical protein
MTSDLKYGSGGHLDDGEPRLSEDDIQRNHLGPRGVLGTRQNDAPAGEEDAPRMLIPDIPLRRCIPPALVP